MTGVIHIVLARKPTEGRTVGNCSKYGVGALNIDGCRVGIDKVNTHSRGNNKAFPKRPVEKTVEESGRKTRQDLIDESERIGRWPANIIHDGSKNIMKEFPTTGIGNNGNVGFRPRVGKNNIYAGNAFSLFDSHTKQTGTMEYCDTGSAGRYFFEVKECKVGE
jgi:site-specific DNA-methyltransferase (adenine-specific)